MNVDVVKGIMFIRLEGDLTTNTFQMFNNELDYLLYKQGMHYFVFNFYEIDTMDPIILSSLQNKLIEIFLCCGKVVMCGLSALWKKIIGTQDRLYFVNDEMEALKYFSI